MKRRAPLHPSIKELLKYPSDAKDADVTRDWKKRIRQVCKPCWELKYCPYGPLVEDFPLPPVTRTESEEHNSYLRDCLKVGRLADGRALDAPTRRRFEE